MHTNADGLSRIARKCKREDCSQCALSQADCVCAVTRNQAKRLGASSVHSNSSSNMSGEEISEDQESQPDALTIKSNTDDETSTKARAEENDTVRTDVLSDTYTKPGLHPNWVNSWSKADIKVMQNNDQAIKQIILLKEERNDPPDKEIVQKADHELKALLHQWEVLEIHDNLLYRKYTDVDSGREFMQMVVPPNLREEILYMLHSHKSAGHLGISKTLGKLRQRFYWPGHKKDVERWCKRCKVCEAVNSSLDPKRAPLTQKPVYKRMDRLALDIVGPVEISPKGNSYILVVCDYVSKYTEAYPMPDITAQTVCDVLCSEWICRFGCPVTLHSDQGKCFESQLFRQMCELFDIHKTRTSRYRPNSDGQTERQNRTIIKMLRCLAQESPKSWEDHLPYVMMAYRATNHSSTNASPNLLTFGEENRLPVDLLYAECTLEQDIPLCPQVYIEWLRKSTKQAYQDSQKHLKASAERQKRNYDRNTYLREFKVGEWVWVLYPPHQQKKFGTGWQGPSLIVQRLGLVNYVVQASENAKRITVHVDHIKEYLHEDTPRSWLC